MATHPKGPIPNTRICNREGCQKSTPNARRWYCDEHRPQPFTYKGIQGTCRICGKSAYGPRAQFCTRHFKEQKREQSREYAATQRRRKGIVPKAERGPTKAQLRAERVAFRERTLAWRIADLRRVWFDLGTLLNRGKPPTVLELRNINRRIREIYLRPSSLRKSANEG